MEQSTLLMSAQIHFVDAQLSLIQIPLKQYQNYIPTILKLLFPPPPAANGQFESEETVSWANAHPFLNVSVTPIEASIVCSKELARELFAPKITQEKTDCSAKAVHSGHASISTETYVVISVEGGGTEAGQRVLELTGPLALAGISLFFITTYFSDYILVPTKARTAVIHALESRGFAFQKSSSSYINPTTHHRATSSTSSLASPTTPPPTTISELQARTFALLNKRSIIPHVDRSLRLIQCAGRRGNPQSSSADELGLQLGLTKCLIHQPSFLSLTLTLEESASILMEKRLLSNFDIGPSGSGSGSGSDKDRDNVLLGSKDSLLIPIILDLESLPFEATGIVCGIAGRLVGGHNILRAIEMSYLSTAKAGTVMVEEEDLEAAVGALRVGVDGSIEP